MKVSIGDKLIDKRSGSLCTVIEVDSRIFHENHVGSDAKYIGRNLNKRKQS